MVVLSRGFWQRRFGGDPSLVDKTIDLDGNPSVVPGIVGNVRDIGLNRDHGPMVALRAE